MIPRRPNSQRNCGNGFRESVSRVPARKVVGKANQAFLVPELRVYRLWDSKYPNSLLSDQYRTNSISGPIGPHTRAMFEVSILTTTQFGAFIPWLIINRGPLLALLHPNTGDQLRDHTQRATWLGGEVPVNTEMFNRKSL